MLRISLALFLLCASAHAMAQNGRAAVAMPGACPEAQDLAEEEPNSLANTPATASAARIKYARPPVSAPTAAPVGGGGSDDSLPRNRGYKWHSFLPGMFR